MSAETTQAECLGRLFDFYDAIDLAAAIDDADQVAWLVQARGECVDELVATVAEVPLSDGIKAEIAEHERRLHLTIVRLHDQLFQSLSAQRQRAHAVTRYAQQH